MNPLDRRKRDDALEAFVGLLRRFVQYVGQEDIEAFESSLLAGTSIAAFGGTRLEVLPFRKGLQNVALKLWRTDMETEGWIKSVSTDDLAEVRACISVVFADRRADRARQAVWALMTRDLEIQTAPQPAFGVAWCTFFPRPGILNGVWIRALSHGYRGPSHFTSRMKKDGRNIAFLMCDEELKVGDFDGTTRKCWRSRKTVDY